jgi:hypothetical protein
MARHEVARARQEQEPIAHQARAQELRHRELLMEFASYDTAQRCKRCLRSKHDAHRPATCWDIPDQEHEWEVTLTPHHEKVRGWRLMLLFTWDLLFNRRKDEF